PPRRGRPQRRGRKRWDGTGDRRRAAAAHRGGHPGDQSEDRDDGGRGGEGRAPGARGGAPPHREVQLRGRGGGEARQVLQGVGHGPFVDDHYAAPRIRPRSSARRSLARAWNIWLLTVPRETPSASAISASVRCS